MFAQLDDTQECLARGAQRKRGLARLVAWVFLAQLALASVAQAAMPGGLDSSFAVGGTAIEQLGAGDRSSASAAALQPDGRVVLAGYANDASGNEDLAITRLTATGAVDSSFNGGHPVIIALGQGATPAAEGHGVAIAPDGRIVVAGFATDMAGNDQIMVVRLNPDGSTDATFNGGSPLLTHVGSGALSDLSAVAVRSDGRIVLAGEAATGVTPVDALVMQLTASGAMDPSFNGGSPVLMNWGGPQSDADAVALMPDGRVVLAGGAHDSHGQFAFAAMRLKADGTPDPSFNGGNVLLEQLATATDKDSFATAVSLEPAGSVVLGGLIETTTPSFHERVAVARISANGTVDASFGNGGSYSAQPGLGTSPSSALFGIAVQPDGKIVAAGDASYAPSRFEALVLRLTGAGAPDPQWNGASVLAFNPGGGTTPRSADFAVALQPNGKVVIVGDATDASGGFAFSTTRLFGDQPPNAAFTTTPAVPAAGQVVTFDATASSDPYNPITSYAWSFGGTGAKLTHAFAKRGVYTVMVTVTDADGLIGTAQRTVTVGPAAIVRFSQSAKRWRLHKQRGSKLPVGTTFRFDLTAVGTIHLTFRRNLPGRTLGHRCVAPTHGNRTHRRCTRIVKRGSVTVAGRAGASKLRFDGDLAGGRRLSPGTYSVTASTSAVSTAPKSLTFTIV